MQRCGLLQSRIELAERIEQAADRAIQILVGMRRRVSILLIECSTVVWCLPPNCRPISGSEA